MGRTTSSRRKFRTARLRAPKRRFYGNQHSKTAKKAVPVDRGDVLKPPLASGRLPAPVISASHSKIGKLVDTERNAESSTTNVLTGDDFVTPTGYRCIDMMILKDAISYLRCPHCHTESSTLGLLESTERQGLASQLTIRCAECDYTSTFFTSAKSSHCYEINRHAVIGIHHIGRGYTDLEKLCGLLNMPHPMAINTYMKHSAVLYRSAVDLAEQVLLSAGEELRQSHLSDSAAGCVDVDVSCDGTWQKRGHSSLYGVVLVIAAETGKVLDYVVKSRVCISCQRHSKLDPSSDTYQLWKQKHLDSGECNQNFEGSANAIECSAALEIWKRSVSKHNLRYTTYIGDGDSKTHTTIVDEKPYGAEIVIKKSDCIGHVQKRLGAALRRKKKEWGKRKLLDGKTIGGRGRLTDQRIDKLQNYYGLAIRNNLNDVSAMQKAVRAILYHSASTTKKPMHHFCPTGNTSWCGWQKNSETYKHHDSIPRAIFEELKPIFERLASTELLQRCALGHTQNANEALNGTIWHLCPKERFVGIETLETAVAIAVCKFNIGAQHTMQRLLASMGLQTGDYTAQALQRMDKSRLYKAKYSASEKTKLERKRKRHIRKGYEEQSKLVEGETYLSGSF